jgi:hypothetical protein
MKKTSYSEEATLPVSPAPPKGSWGNGSYDAQGRGVKVGGKPLPLQRPTGERRGDPGGPGRPSRPGRW